MSILGRVAPRSPTPANQVGIEENLASRRSPPTPLVTAVVLNWCDAAATTACVTSLQESDYPRLSILIVDNGSPDGSGEELHARFPDVGFLQTGENLGYTGGNNRGIWKALDEGSDYVLVLNHDTLVEPDVVSTLVESGEASPGAAAIAPTVVRMDDPDQIWYGGGAFDPTRGLGIHWNGNGKLPGSSEPQEVTFFSGCSVLLRAQALREVGAFAEGYFLYIEDAELSIRLVQAGWTILHDPRAHVRHRAPPRGEEPRPEQIRYRDRNRRRLVREHLGLGQRVRFSAWFYPTRVIHLIRYLGRGDIPRAEAILKGLMER